MCSSDVTHLSDARLPDLELIGTTFALPRDRTPDDPLARRALELLLSRIAGRTLRALMHFLAGPYRWGSIDDLALLAEFGRREIDEAKRRADESPDIGISRNDRVLIALFAKQLLDEEV